MPPTHSIDSVRKIRRWDLVSLGFNFIVGGGIFGMPSKVFKLSGVASLFAYIICACAVTLIVLCFAEVGSRFKETGGPYLYARKAFGPIVGFEVGWLRWLSGIASCAAISNLFVDYLGYIWPTASSSPWRGLLIAAVILLVTVINVVGVRQVAIASNLFAIGKLLPLLLFIGVGVFFMNPHNFSPRPWQGYGSLSQSALILIYAFTGFESVAIAAGEVQEPQRNVPFALFLAIGTTTFLYFMIQLVCIGTLPGLATSARPLADASSQFLGPVGAYLISIGAMISIAGTLNGHMLATPRMLSAMAEQEQLPPMYAVTHKIFGTPYIAIGFSAIAILGFALSGTFIQLAIISAMTRLTIYIVTCAALPVLRHKQNIPKSSFTLSGGLVVSIAAVMLCGWLLLNSTIHEARAAAIAAGVGLILYYLHRFSSAKRPQNKSSSLRG